MSRYVVIVVVAAVVVVVIDGPVSLNEQLKVLVEVLKSLGPRRAGLLHTLLLSKVSLKGLLGFKLKLLLLLLW